MAKRTETAINDDEAVVEDPDNPEWTEEDFARAKPVHELPGELREAIYAAFPNTRRRGPQKAPTKVRTTVRLSPQVREHFIVMSGKSGRPWQTLMDETLVRLVEQDRAGDDRSGRPS